MSVESFLDTNLFIYQLDRSDLRKAEIADNLSGGAIRRGEGCISFQVIQECLNIILRKAELPLELRDARAYLDHVLKPLRHVTASAQLYPSGLDIQGRYHYSFHDSLIIAAALEAGCARLLSEDMQDGQRIDSLTIANLFAGLSGVHE